MLDYVPFILEYVLNILGHVKQSKCMVKSQKRTIFSSKKRSFPRYYGARISHQESGAHLCRITAQMICAVMRRTYISDRVVNTRPRQARMHLRRQ
jgi:hypothetical protein